MNSYIYELFHAIFPSENREYYLGSHAHSWVSSLRRMLRLPVRAQYNDCEKVQIENKFPDRG